VFLKFNSDPADYIFVKVSAVKYLQDEEVRVRGAAGGK